MLAYRIEIIIKGEYYCKDENDRNAVAEMT